MYGKKYRKKPVVIEALQFLDEGERIQELSKFVDDQVLVVTYKDKENPKIILQTLEGVVFASVGDYIVKGVDGEFYPCKPTIFEQTYEEVTEE